MRTNGCPSPAELAKFLDGKLSASEARRLRVHVAGCEACQEVVSEAMVFLEGKAGGESEEPMEAEAQPHPFPARDAVRPAVGEGSDSREEPTGGGLAMPGRWLPLAAAVVLALGLAAAWWLTSRPAGDLEALAGAQGEHRQTLVRLGGFPHAPPEPVQRSGSGGDEPAYALLAEAARLEAQAAESPSAAHLHALGLAHLMLGRHDDAVATLERAGEATGDPALERRIQTDLAAALLEKGLETGQARTVARAHELLAELVEERPDPDLLFNAALALEELGARRSAIDTWDRYLEADPDTPWAEEARRRRDRLVEMEQVEPEASAESMEDRVLLDLLGQSDGISPAALEEAATLAEDYQGRFQDPWLAEAVESLRRATGEDRTRLEELHRTYAVARTAKVENRINDCLAASSAGLALSGGEVGPVRLALTLVGGSCTFMTGDLAEAGYRGTRVAEDGGEKGYPVLAGQGAWLAALAAHSGLRVGEALHHYRESQRHLAATGDLQRQAAVAARIADLHHFAGRPGEAWNAAVAALRGSGQEPQRRHQALGVTANLGADLTLPRTRLRLLEEAAALNPEVPPDHRSEVWRELGSLHGELGDEAAARDAFRRGEEAVMAVSDPTVQARARAFLDADVAAFLAERDPEAARLRLGSASSYEDSAASLYYDLARTRSRIALTEGDEDKAEEVLATALASVDEELAQLVGLEARATLLQVRSRMLRDYVHLLVEQGEEAAAWHTVQRSRHAVLTHRRLAVLGRQGAAVATGPSYTYLALEDELLVWRATGRELELRRVAVKRTTLTRWVEQVRRWNETGSEEEAGQEAARRLVELLFAPSDLRERQLVLDPGETLGSLPFASLPHPASGRPLALHLATVLSGSGAKWAGLGPPSRGRGCVLLIEGSPQGPPSLGLRRLQRIDEELEAVGALYPCRYRARTRDQIAAILRSGVDVVHYAGHVVEGPAGGLLLAGEAGRDTAGELSAVVPLAEVENWPLSGTTVVLSACSGARVLPESSGLASLAHAFLKAGSSSVVAARWPVSDSEALPMAVGFHVYQTQGMPAPEALRRAQAMAIQQGRDRPSWAGWVVLG